MRTTILIPGSAQRASKSVGFLGTRRAGLWMRGPDGLMILGAAGWLAVSPFPAAESGFVMSMQAQPWPEVPALTARVARAAFPKGSRPIRARDELGAWCADADFAGCYQVAGRPGISPAQLAMVCVLQFTEDLTDRQAADAVRGRLDWKYCLGLDLDDAGFDFSVLSEFRDRLVAGGAERVVFDLLLGQLTGRGLVGAGGRQRTDSTHVLARIRQLSRLELAGESVRAALEALAAAAPGWLATVIDASWQEAYGQRIDQVRLPASQAKRDALAVRYGRDGYRLLAAVRQPGAPGWARDLPAVAVLRQVWVQQYYREVSDGGEKVIWRDAEQGLPPGRARIVSPYDTDARYSQKRATRWEGYKAHLTETVSDPAGDDPVTGRPAVPNLITNVATTPAPVTDHEMTGPVHDSLQARQVTPGEHVVDAGYASADALLSARARGITLLGPLLAAATPQARAGGYTTAAFTIDWYHQQVTCPQGQHSASWTRYDDRGRDSIIVKFPPAACRPCPVRDQCTTSARSGRQLGLRPRPVHEAVTAARAEQDTDEWKARYAARAGVEGTIAQATAVTGLRRARYTGLAKTTLQHALAATAINLTRLDAWWTHTPLDRRRTTHLQRLDLAPAA
jgi:transposase